MKSAREYAYKVGKSSGIPKRDIDNYFARRGRGLNGKTYALLNMILAYVGLENGYGIPELRGERMLTLQPKSSEGEGQELFEF